MSQKKLRIRIDNGMWVLQENTRYLYWSRNFEAVCQVAKLEFAERQSAFAISAKEPHP